MDKEIERKFKTLYKIIEHLENRIEVIEKETLKNKERAAAAQSSAQAALYVANYG